MGLPGLATGRKGSDGRRGVVVRGAGHDAHLDDSAAVYGEMAAFLRDWRVRE
ncbi:hypothetical protein EES46_25735 [Streptomyces sp. ADI98-10]|nr:hypothetical protein EES46_25735 [Streptomyces sp. ADI98-10]